MLDGIFAFLDCAAAATDRKSGQLVRVLGGLVCVTMLIGGAILLYDHFA